MNFYNKHILNDFFLKKNEILIIIELSKKNIKTKIKKNICIINEKKSLRTLNTLINSINNNKIKFINIENKHEIKKENYKDFSRTLGLFFNSLYYRGSNDFFLKLISKFSGINIINILSNGYHPIQSISDLTIILKYKKNILYFFGDCNSNVLRSILIICSKINNIIIILSPKKNWNNIFLKKIFSKKKIIFSEKLILTNKNILLYTDVWLSMGKNDFFLKVYNNFINYKINKKLFYLLKIKKILHCLPSHKNIFLINKKKNFEIEENIFESNFIEFNNQIINKIKIFNSIFFLENKLFFKI